jgi:Rhodanese-like domain
VLSPFGLTVPATVAELDVTLVASPVVALGAPAAVAREAIRDTRQRLAAAAIVSARSTAADRSFSLPAAISARMPIAVVPKRKTLSCRAFSGGRRLCRMPERIDIHRLRELLQRDVQLVEVLPAKEYREQHLPGAISVPLKELDAATVGRLDKDRPTVVYCWDSI